MILYIFLLLFSVTYGISGLIYFLVCLIQVFMFAYKISSMDLSPLRVSLSEPFLHLRFS